MLTRQPRKLSEFQFQATGHVRGLLAETMMLNPMNKRLPGCILVHLCVLLHGVYESIKILYEAGKDIERAINR